MTDEEQVKQILIEFFKEMNHWENYSYSRLQEKKDDMKHFKDTFEIARVELQKIYDKYLTKKKRVFTTRHSSLGNPPAYDYLIEDLKQITTKSKKRIEVETFKNDAVGLRNQYVFLKEDGEWKIDNKKTYWNHKGKFESTII